MGEATMQSLFVAVGAVAFLLNILEISMILRTKKKMKPFEKLLLSLSIADSLIAISAVAFYILEIADVSLGKMEAKFIVLLLISGAFSVVFVFGITLDRFLAVKKPLQHNLRMQGRFPNILITILWVTAIILSVTSTIIAIKSYTLFLLMSKVCSAMLILLGLCYALTYRHMMKTVLINRAKLQMKDKAEIPKSCPVQRILFHSGCRRERTMLITSSLVVVSYIICMYPITIEILAVDDTKKVSNATQLLLLVNSICNPLVYFYKGLRERRSREGNKETSSKKVLSLQSKSNETNQKPTEGSY